ncbi:ABC-F family ATP-binding cassette domain-containing protein [Candidatus Saccharibacteria bacterium]|nr:ABC-F family ATP-binding cassette domain-containing protein [Candidatus Saccharibacteria bacterium]MCB9821465.1 ABC-F family ATP-binding cassette domain-containing protein [Candidatus Nomurabacteria bacterium]
MLELAHIYKTLGDKLILQDINLGIDHEVVALIGKNGAGKSTLLQIILGQIEADEGTVKYRGAVGYVPQHPQLANTVGGCFGSVESWQADIAMAEVGLEKSLTFPTSKLSGGQKTKLALAMVLAQAPRPSILLLDEPTNNLDATALRWLEDYIKHFKGLVILVSHDRSFINRTCTKVLLLEATKLTIYKGNYDDYKSQKELELQHQLLEYQSNLDEKKRLNSLLQAKSQQMQATSNQCYNKLMGIPKISFNTNKNASQTNTGRQIKAINSRIEQLASLEKPDIAKDYLLELNGAVRGGKLVVKLDNINVDFLPKVNNFCLEIRGQQRVVVVGPNGCGKTTLLRIAHRSITPSSGVVVVGAGISIGYISQEVSGLDFSLSSFENLLQSNSDRTVIHRQARALGLEAAALGLKPNELSRGQQSKLSFAKLLLGNHDLLILDEPTNHLDIATRDSIEHALELYRGAMLVASHDEYFLESIGITQTISLMS